MTRIDVVTAPAEMAPVRELFVEYAEWLGQEHCFQGFQQELDHLPGDYAPPSGRLLLARDRLLPVGCAALRSLGDGAAGEMKRLYVRPSHRNQGLGHRLVAEIIALATQIGYSRLVLDTLPVMVRARALYHVFGFREIAPHHRNPLPGAVYMALELAGGAGPRPPGEPA